MATGTNGLDIAPSGKALGADIRGIDLNKPFSDEIFGMILDAWHRHLVLRFREQDISDDALVAFALRFGQLHSAEGAEYGGKPEELHSAVELISNIVRDGKAIGALGAGEATWHTDMSMFEVPATATFLLGDEIPPSGEIPCLPISTRPTRLSPMNCARSWRRGGRSTMRPIWRREAYGRDTRRPPTSPSRLAHATRS